MPFITLTSDIGTHDYLIGAIKGQIVQGIPGASIIDLNHHLSSSNYTRSAYLCRPAIKHFPAKSVHIILLNMFELKPAHILLARHGDHYFACADNGFLPLVLETEPDEVVALPLSKTQPKNLLYCTEVIVQAIARIDAGEPLSAIGDTDVQIISKNPLKPTVGTDWIEGQIIFIDQFENVVVNITRDDFENQRNGRRFSIEFRRDEMIDKISETYADVPEGEKLALFNSAGYLEIAINGGNAAGLFGLRSFSDKMQTPNQQQVLDNQLLYQTIKVFFE